MKDVSARIENLESRRTRKPAEIYDFWNDTLEYYITSADEPITYDGNLYTPEYIERERISHNGDLTVSKLSINVDKLQEEVLSYLNAAPLDETWVRVMRVFRNQTPTEAMVYFVGTINNVRIKGRTATLLCDGLEKYFSQLVPRFRYQRLCTLTLYDDNGTWCGVDKSSFLENVTLTGLTDDGLNLTSATFSAKADGYYDFGWVEFDGYKRMISSHTDDTIIIRHYIPGLTDTDTVVVYPGCNKTMGACRDKFNNLGNDSLNTYFGLPYMPFDNPVRWS